MKTGLQMFQVKVNATGEIKECATIKECLEWAKSVRKTFMDDSMTFQLITVTTTTEPLYVV